MEMKTAASKKQICSGCLLVYLVREQDAVEPSSSQAIHCTNGRVLKRMYWKAFKYEASKTCNGIWKSDTLHVPK